MDQNTKSSPADHPASVVLMASMLVGSLMIALIGALLPGWVGITGTPAILISLVFYAVAAIDVAIALWLRARLKKARQSSARGGGQVQRP
jgi:quinol-cytochrome oxidoreductase complex cytochrome b subunit